MISVHSLRKSCHSTVLQDCFLSSSTNAKCEKHAKKLNNAKETREDYVCKICAIQHRVLCFFILLPQSPSMESASHILLISSFHSLPKLS